MTSISCLATQSGAVVSGLFRLISVKRSPTTERDNRARVTIADATGFAICDVSLSYKGFLSLTDIRTRFVQVEGRVLMTPSDVVHIDTHRIEKVARADRPSWHLLSRTWVPAESMAAFDRLTALLDRLTDPHVRALAHRLFISQQIAEPFLCVPASRSHHHAGIGGLLIHSVECAEMAESLSRYVLPTHERDLAVMGALLHDLAKIRIMKSGQVGRHAIYGVTQEALNLEVLAPFLKRLDREWPEGGAGLREILAPTYRGASSSPLLVTDLVRYMDRLSAGAEIRAQRFRGAPAWRHCVKTEQGALIKRILPAAGIKKPRGFAVSTGCDQAYDEFWGLAFDDPPTIKLFDHVQLKKAHEAESTNAGRRDALSRLLKSGEHRRLATATSDMMDSLDALQRRQPNCIKVIANVRRQVALSLLADSRVLRWSPQLLDGPPGIGKTYFARSLAEALGVPLFVVDCSSVTASFVLGGNSPSWAGSRPGKIVEALWDSSVGNPIILLDEVDKLRGDLRFDGYGPLYQLLEEDTARLFEDEHIGVPIDASRILWFATSNHLHMLPEPIRSRFDTLTIDTPLPNHMSAITQSVYDDLLATENGWAKRFCATLPTDVKRVLSGVPPREIRRVLTSVMGQAALRRLSNRKIRIRLEDLDIEKTGASAGIGFLA